MAVLVGMGGPEVWVCISLICSDGLCALVILLSSLQAGEGRAHLPQEGGSPSEGLGLAWPEGLLH